MLTWREALRSADPLLRRPKVPCPVLLVEADGWERGQALVGGHGRGRGHPAAAVVADGDLGQGGRGRAMVRVTVFWEKETDSIQCIVWQFNKFEEVSIFWTKNSRDNVKKLSIEQEKGFFWCHVSQDYLLSLLTTKSPQATRRFFFIQQSVFQWQGISWRGSNFRTPGKKNRLLKPVFLTNSIKFFLLPRWSAECERVRVPGIVVVAVHARPPPEPEPGVRVVVPVGTQVLGRDDRIMEGQGDGSIWKKVKFCQKMQFFWSISFYSGVRSQGHPGWIERALKSNFWSYVVNWVKI